MDTACDILVAGGGVSGVPAAVAAARAGARVVLVEKAVSLGGAGVAALHRSICGLYLNGPAEPKETLHPGLPCEIVARLKAVSPGSHPQRAGRVWVFPFETTHFGAVYEALARGEKNLTVLRSSAVDSVDCDGKRINAVTLRTPGKLSTFRPSAVIDATGAGEVIRLSGAPFELAPSPERQSGGCTVHLDGLVGDRQLLGVRIAWILSQISASESWPLFAGFTAGPAPHDGFCKFTLPPALDGLDSAALAERIGRLHALLAAQMPELARSRILAQSPRMEPEGLRLAGQWELDEASILAARKFPDGVARSAWPVEFWDPSAAAPGYAYPPDGDYAEIPRRCLRSRSIANLFAAGRCISASSRALAATRVMGTCMALGEAAGCEAARFTQPP